MRTVAWGIALTQTPDRSAVGDDVGPTLLRSTVVDGRSQAHMLVTAIAGEK